MLNIEIQPPGHDVDGLPLQNGDDFETERVPGIAAELFKRYPGLCFVDCGTHNIFMEEPDTYEHWVRGAAESVSIKRQGEWWVDQWDDFEVL